MTSPVDFGPNRTWFEVLAKAARTAWFPASENVSEPTPQWKFVDLSSSFPAMPSRPEPGARQFTSTINRICAVCNELETGGHWYRIGDSYQCPSCYRKALRKRAKRAREAMLSSTRYCPESLDEGSRPQQRIHRDDEPATASTGAHTGTPINVGALYTPPHTPPLSG